MVKVNGSTDEDKTKFLRPIKVIAAAKRVIPGIKKAAEIFFIMIFKDWSTKSMSHKQRSATFE